MKCPKCGTEIEFVENLELKYCYVDFWQCPHCMKVVTERY